MTTKAPAINLSILKGVSGGIQNLLERRPNVGWGNVANMDEKTLLDEGFYAAYREAVKLSEHLASSGMSNRMTRKERKEHYRRKAELEVRKAKERREQWERRHPGGRESEFARKEKARVERKAVERAARRTVKRGRRSSSGGSGR
jgi:hypothetical protein